MRFLGPSVHNGEDESSGVDVCTVANDFTFFESGCYCRVSDQAGWGALTSGVVQLELEFTLLLLGLLRWITNRFLRLKPTGLEVGQMAR